MIPETIPVILESIVSAEFIDDEIEAAHEAIGDRRPPAAHSKTSFRRDARAASRVDRCLPEPQQRLSHHVGRHAAFSLEWGGDGLQRAGSLCAMSGAVVLGAWAVVLGPGRVNGGRESA